MKKKDLRTGMQVEQRCGTRKVVLLGTMEGDVIVEVGKTEFGRLSEYSDDLTKDMDSDYDIMKVYQSSYANYYLVQKFGEECLIWERTPDIEITVKLKGKESTLKDISEETLLKIRNNG